MASMKKTQKLGNLRNLFFFPFNNNKAKRQIEFTWNMVFLPVRKLKGFMQRPSMALVCLNHHLAVGGHSIERFFFLIEKKILVNHLIDISRQNTVRSSCYSRSRVTVRNVTPVLLSERLEESPEVKRYGIMHKKTPHRLSGFDFCFKSSDCTF